MFRRSLYIFGAIVLLGLALTVGYALMGFGGPHTAIADARALFAQGEYLRVVADLDLAERSYSLKRDPPKHRDLLELRYKAHSQLGNWPLALRDLERLMAMSPSLDEELRLDHIRLLAITGNGERALQEAKTFLGEQPEHGRALELAGEACQTVYRDELRALLEAVELDVGARLAEEAQAALLAYLYRPDADAEVAQAIESLRQIYARESQLVAAWPPLKKRLEGLRSRIQQSLGYFQKSLEFEGQHVAAFQGLALSLEQSQRFDDLLILCECYRRRFDHEYVYEAGHIAAWALVSLGLDEAAVAAAIRWLTPGTAEQRYREHKLGAAALDLFLARIVAAWGLRDPAALQRVQPDIQALVNAGLTRLRLAGQLARGLLHYLRENQEQCESQLGYATRTVVRNTTPHGQQDLLPLIMRVRIENLRRASTAEATITELFKVWIEQRPTAVEPLIALAEHQLENGAFSAAMATARTAQQLVPGDESVLDLRVRIAPQLYRDAEQDGDGLLAQCLQRLTAVPEVPDPVCYLLCGEAALAANVPVVALACGRAALEAMPWARAGRLLEAKAELLADRPAAAARIMRELVDASPPDQETLALALTACRAAELPAAGLLWTAMRSAPADDEFAATMLRRAQNEDPRMALPLARALVDREDLPSALVVLTASAFARAGDRATAERLLESLFTGDPAVTLDQRDLAGAIANLLRLTADRVVDDARLTDVAVKWCHDFGVATSAAAPELLALAQDLAGTHPKTAYSLLTIALAAADPEDRSGATLVLAGDLALQLGHLTLAENHWTAALAFPDGRTAAEPLARLCLATNRPERALQVYRLAVDPRDPALALRCGNVAAAEGLITESMARDGGDLLTHLTVTVVGMPSLTSDLELETDAERETVLELASLLHSRELAPFALPRAKELAAARPVPSALLLLARAHALTGNLTEAARLHGKLFLEGLTTLPLWREVAEASCRPGYDPLPILTASFVAAAAQGDLEKSPFAFAVANMRIAEQVAAAGHADLALQYRSAVWQQFTADGGFPAHTRPTLENADALIAAGRPLEAWWVLDRLRPTLESEERLGCIERMLTIAHATVATEAPEQASVRRTLYGAVVQLADDEGPLGGIVHFLLDHKAAFEALAPDNKRISELLRGHLQTAAAGRDRGDLVPRTVNLLVDEQGLARTLEAVEAALSDHPLALDLWRERTWLLQRQRRGVEGVADMRRVLAHVRSPEHVLDFTAQAAVAFALTRQDVEAVAKIHGELKNSARGKLVRGLVELRRGRPDRAVPLLEEAGDDGGAIRLMALAQALLQSKLEDATPRAIAALEQLSADYPSSSAARYAGNFARQLSPR